MNKPIKISAELLGRNTLFNFIGQVIPMLVGVVTIPIIVRGLGTERFGLLSLAWVILGYFSIFDLGLGRATTKFVAEALGKGEEEEIPYLVWTTVTVQVILGIVGGLVLVGITPILANHILDISPELIEEAKATFYLLALSVPAVFIYSSFSGVLEAKQRFELINGAKMIIASLTFILPLIGTLLGFCLPNIVASILMAKIMGLMVIVIMNFHLMPELKKYACAFTHILRLFSFGGWVTITNIISPILVYLDRFLIASLLTMDVVTYYVVPFEIVARLSIIPISLSITLFPAFSTLKETKDRYKLGMLFAYSIKYILLILGPIVIVIELFAKEILQIWLGAEFAMKSPIILQLLAFAVLINSLGQIPFALLQGLGRPDVPAKFHLFELPVYTVGAWLLINHWGIVGAAVAWTIRVTLDAILLYMATFKLCQFLPRLMEINFLIILMLLLLLGTSYGLKSLISAFPLFAQLWLFVANLGLFAWFIWKKALDTLEKYLILKMIKLWWR